MRQCHKHTRGHVLCFTVFYTGVGKFLDQGQPAKDRLSSVPPKPNAVAMEAQMSIVKKYVMDKENNHKYVALLGMGGIGKTTLAKELINDDEVQKEFQVCGFVVIAQHPNIVHCQNKIWTTLLQSFHERREFSTAEDGKMQLQSALKDKHVFLVIDDVWNEEHMDYLDVVSAHSRVLVTSRNEAVAKYVGARCHRMKHLNDAQSMELFCRHAFGGGKPSKGQKVFVDEIVKECSGIPLALGVMGGEARACICDERSSVGISCAERGKWQRAVARLEEQGVVHGTVFDRIFGLSFESLEGTHQEVLLDLAMLPEDYHIRRSDLIEWQLNSGACEDEISACCVLEELERRSLILGTGVHLMQVLEFQSSDALHYHLHDVIRDCALAKIASQPLSERVRLVSSHIKSPSHTDSTFSATKFSISQGIKENQPWKLQELSMPQLEVLVLREADISELPTSLLLTKLVSIDISSSGILKLPPEISLLKHVKLLRVDNCDKLSCLPSELGSMEHLRVLSMRGCSSIYEIPESVGELGNLTILLMPSCGIAHFLQSKLEGLRNLSKMDLSRCFALKRLPQTIGDLRALTALNLGGCWQLTCLPFSIGQLTELQVLLLNGCSHLTAIPESVTNLHKLRELDIQDCTSLESLPKGIGEGCPQLSILRLQGNVALDFPKMVNWQQLEVLGLPLSKHCAMEEGAVRISILGTTHGLPKGWNLHDALLEDVQVEENQTEEWLSNEKRVRCKLLDF